MSDEYEIDPTTTSPARVYDLSLGGSDNLPVDRRAVERFLEVMPEAFQPAAWNRAFLGRAVGYLAQDLGIRQFLDIGSGLPAAAGNVHDIAQAAVPDARVVYVDNDAMTHAHAVALLEGADRVAFVSGDVRSPAVILDAPEVAALIDWSEPVGVLCVALFHFVGDEHDPAGLVRALTARAAAGSALVVSHLTSDGMAAEVAAVIGEVYGRGEAALRPRSREAVKGLFPWPLTEPGLVRVQHWRNGESIPAGRMDLLGGVAVKGR